MRVLIEPGMKLSYLLPLAKELQREGPMAEGPRYEGDLQAAAFTFIRDPVVWTQASDFGREVRNGGQNGPRSSLKDH